MKTCDTATAPRRGTPFPYALIVFLVCSALFFAAVVALNQWGAAWARAAYEPILAERVNAACARQRYGEAEHILLQALDSSPAYARFVHDLADEDLLVMPQLTYALARTPKADEPLPPFSYFTPQTNIDALSPYRRFFALMATGHAQAARALLESTAVELRALPDAAFQLGQLCEGAGNNPGALRCYARALAVSNAHLDAARAYLRLISSNRESTNTK